MVNFVIFHEFLILHRKKSSSFLAAQNFVVNANNFLGVAVLWTAKCFKGFHSCSFGEVPIKKSIYSLRNSIFAPDEGISLPCLHTP